MTTQRDPQSSTGLREHLMFLALLIPTFVVIAAAAVSLAHPDPSVAVPASETVAACDSCASENAQPGAE